MEGLVRKSFVECGKSLNGRRSLEPNIRRHITSFESFLRMT